MSSSAFFHHHSDISSSLSASDSHFHTIWHIHHQYQASDHQAVATFMAFSTAPYATSNLFGSIGNTMPPPLVLPPGQAHIRSSWEHSSALSLHKSSHHSCCHLQHSHCIHICPPTTKWSPCFSPCFPLLWCPSYCMLHDWCLTGVLPRHFYALTIRHASATCYVHTCQDCIRIGKFSFIIYDGMRPLIMTACHGSFLP